MWYFAWVLGTALAVCFSIINALWHEMRDDFKEEKE
jgi:cyd operon protein YbgT